MPRTGGDRRAGDPAAAEADCSAERPDSNTLACPCPIGGDHAGEWDPRAGRFVCRRCKLLIRGHELVDVLAGDLAELAWYQRHLDLDHLARPGIGPKTRLLALALRLLGEYANEDGERGQRVLEALGAVGLALPGVPR